MAPKIKIIKRGKVTAVLLPEGQKPIDFNPPKSVVDEALKALEAAGKKS